MSTWLYQTFTSTYKLWLCASKLQWFHLQVLNSCDTNMDLVGQVNRFCPDASRCMCSLCPLSWAPNLCYMILQAQYWFCAPRLPLWDFENWLSSSLLVAQPPHSARCELVTTDRRADDVNKKVGPALRMRHANVVWWLGVSHLVTI